MLKIINVAVALVALSAGVAFATASVAGGNQSAQGNVVNSAVGGGANFSFAPSMGTGGMGAVGVGGGSTGSAAAAMGTTAATGSTQGAGGSSGATSNGTGSQQ